MEEVKEVEIITNEYVTIEYLRKKGELFCVSVELREEVVGWWYLQKKVVKEVDGCAVHLVLIDNTRILIGGEEHDVPESGPIQTDFHTRYKEVAPSVWRDARTPEEAITELVRNRRTATRMRLQCLEREQWLKANTLLAEAVAKDPEATRYLLPIPGHLAPMLNLQATPSADGIIVHSTRLMPQFKVERKGVSLSPGPLKVADLAKCDLVQVQCMQTGGKRKTSEYFYLISTPSTLFPLEGLHAIVTSQYGPRLTQIEDRGGDAYFRDLRLEVITPDINDEWLDEAAEGLRMTDRWRWNHSESSVKVIEAVWKAALANDSLFVKARDLPYIGTVRWEPEGEGARVFFS